jgi:hypothetical protein
VRIFRLVALLTLPILSARALALAADWDFVFLRRKNVLGIINRAIPITLSVVLIILVGCGDEEQGFSNPLQIELSTLQIELLTEKEESSPKGSITGRIIFTDKENQIRAHALSSNEYVIFQGSSAKDLGKDLVVFVDFPSNNSAYLMEGGYFQITDVEPGTHELFLTHTADTVIVTDPGILPGGNYTKIDVPTSQWTVTVEPDRNTTMGSLIVLIPDLEWQSGEAGQEIVVPQEPELPVIPTKPPAIRPANPSARLATAVVATTDKKHEQQASVNQEGSTFTIKAGGNDIWGNADQFTFAYQEWSGDFDMIVTVNSLGRTNDWSKAGPMARQNLEPGSINVFAACRGLDDLITFQHRATPNGSSSSERFTPNRARRPVTIKLTRRGDQFYGGWSLDGGKTWEDNVTGDGVTKTPSIILKMEDPILLGIAVTSHEEGVITTSEIEVLSSPFGGYAVSAGGKLATIWGNLKRP